jgi:uncharacterized protein (TIRG00374 family)
MVAKSGGLAGLSVFRREAARRDVPSGPVTAAYVTATVGGDAAFAALLVVALTVLTAAGRMQRPELLACGVFVVYLLVTAGLLVAATRSREALGRIRRLPERLTRRVRRSPSRAEPSRSDDLFDAVERLRTRPSAAIPVLAMTFGIELAGVAILFASMRAVGVGAGVVVALVGYAVSTLFAIVGVLPSGLGFAEVSLGAVLVSYGVPAATATVVVLVDRLLEMWLPLLVGFVALGRSARSATP